MNYLGICGIILGIVVGNYVYQFILPNPDWAVAFERSYFQVVAVGVVTLFLWVEG